MNEIKLTPELVRAVMRQVCLHLLERGLLPERAYIKVGEKIDTLKIRVK